MTKEEALKLLRGGKEGIAEWNSRRAAGENIPSLQNAILDGAILHDVNLDLATLTNATFNSANFVCASLVGANLSNAGFLFANVMETDLSNAVLRSAYLGAAHFDHCNLAATAFAHAAWDRSTITNVDLSEAHGLDTAKICGPCSIGVDTLVRSKGQIPESFLRGCGFQRWQAIQAKTYDPGLTRDQFTDLQYQVNIARNQGPLFIGGVFISYSHDDTGFVDKMHGRLEKEGAPVWLDRHDMVAGDLQKQVSRAIRLNDVVLLVLSESSVDSDWVEHELEMARKKEKDEGRDVLCPVALDGSWKAKMDDVLWRQVMKKNVLDFSKWKTQAFEPAYQKLTAGLKVNYGPPPDVPAIAAT